jgi:hypothetical protein
MTEQQKRELITGFGFVDFDNCRKDVTENEFQFDNVNFSELHANPETLKIYELALDTIRNEIKYSSQSREAFRILQGRKKVDTTNEITKQEFKNFVQTEYQNSIDNRFKHQQNDNRHTM